MRCRRKSRKPWAHDFVTQDVCITLSEIPGEPSNDEETISLFHPRAPASGGLADRTRILHRHLSRTPDGLHPFSSSWVIPSEAQIAILPSYSGQLPLGMLPMMLVCFLLVLGSSTSSSFSSLERGDQEFAVRNYPLALAVYDSALAASKDSAGVLWRLARVYVCLADVAPEEQQLDLYRKGEAFAVRSISADSTKSEGHSWRAAALGNVAMFEGSKAKVRLCTVIKQELDCAIAINPRDDIAFSILGSFYRALGNVSWLERQLAALFLGDLPEGGYRESERALRQAITLAPRVIRHHFELGVLYQEMDRNEEALAEYRQVIALPLFLASDAARQISASRLVEDLAEQEGPK